MLIILSELPHIFTFNLFGKSYLILPLKLIVAVLMIYFALAEVRPKTKNILHSKKYLFGGIMSSFWVVYKDISEHSEVLI